MPYDQLYSGMASCFSIFLALWKTVLQVCLFSCLLALWIDGKPESHLSRNMEIQYSGFPFIWPPVFPYSWLSGKLYCGIVCFPVSCLSVYPESQRAIYPEIWRYSTLVSRLYGLPAIQRYGFLFFHIPGSLEDCIAGLLVFKLTGPLDKRKDREPFIQKYGDTVLWFPVYMASHVTIKPGKQSSIDPFFLKYRRRYI
jgi:hypothetical protein